MTLFLMDPCRCQGTARKTFNLFSSVTRFPIYLLFNLICRWKLYNCALKFMFHSTSLNYDNYVGGIFRFKSF